MSKTNCPRLGGHYAHVFDEAIDVRRDAAKNEVWLMIQRFPLDCTEQNPAPHEKFFAPQ